MGRDLYENAQAARSVFDMGERRKPGILARFMEADGASLTETILTQPCVYLVDLACARALQAEGIQADGAAGFSLGEVAAAAFCGMYDDEAGFEIVLKRAELMQADAQVNPGVMLAVLKLKVAQVEEIAAGLTDVWPVNYNCPGQTVVAAALQSAEAVEKAVKERGGRVIRLNVSGAFHSPYMARASQAFLDVLADHECQTPSIPLYANLTALPYAGDLKATLAAQVKSPVRFWETIERMIADGFTDFVEVGPGQTLAGLVKKIGGAQTIRGVQDMDGLRAAARMR
jgi:[acyl-carrier-protein] S-malonyltransferase